jgi:saccharopine dehydrogenase-like NADP-dependent oxidoreductase
VNDWEVCDIELKGKKDGRAVERHALARFPPKPEWDLTATEYAVGVCGAIGAEMIAKAEVTGKGVLPPELCIPADRFRQELAARGIPTAIVPPEKGLPDWVQTDPASHR